MTTPDEGRQAARRERRAVLLRLDPAVHDALARWAADDLRSLNAHVELLLRDALRDAGRAPRDAGPLPRRGRPRTTPATRSTDEPGASASTQASSAAGATGPARAGERPADAGTEGTEPRPRR